LRHGHCRRPAPTTVSARPCSVSALAASPSPALAGRRRALLAQLAFGCLLDEIAPRGTPARGDVSILPSRLSSCCDCSSSCASTTHAIGGGAVSRARILRAVLRPSGT
jgi:hypothetical protein